MPGIQDKALVSGTSVCSRDTDEISRCVLTAIAVILRGYPAAVDISHSPAASSESEAARKVINMLVQQEFLAGSQAQMSLTLNGFRAVKEAEKTNLGLVEFFRTSPEKTYCDHTALFLSLLRAYFLQSVSRRR